MKRARAGRLLLAVLATTFTLFVLCIAPTMARARDARESLSATRRSEAEIDAMVNAMLVSGNFVEGEAIVCCLERGAGGLTPQSDDLLADAELLSEVTARQYAEATGEALPAAHGITAQSADEPVEIVLVRADGTSTEQLLRELLSNPRVLSAEPNYVMSFASDDEVPVDTGDVESSDDTSTGTDASDGSDDVVDEMTVDSPDVAPVESPIATNADPVSPASTDLTPYQWFSVGAEGSLPQYPNASNPGIHSPHWSEPGTTNSSGVVVIMDSGVDYTHPDLVNVMYRFSPDQQAELGCGEFGYAPHREDPTDPMDGYYHGTHCAGIVAAEWNDFGVSGVANGVKLIAVSVSESVDNSDFSYDAIIKGYDFVIRAAEAGVDIRAINRSLVCDPINNANEAMVRAAGEMGIVTCCAAGNDGHDVDAMYDVISADQANPYVLRIVAADLQDSRAFFSSYGRYTADLFAPGVSILSTIPLSSEKQSRYFPQADDAPLYFKTDFGGTLLNVQETGESVINDVSEGNIGVDGDSSSLKVSVSTTIERPNSFLVDVPIGDLGKKDIGVISLALNACEHEARSSISVLLDDGEFSDISYTEAIEVVNDAGHGGWVFDRLYIHPEDMEKDYAYVTDTQGNRCLRLKVSATLVNKTLADGTDVDVDIYVDQIAIGSPDNIAILPYMYESGTSMASPVVTGSAAIVSSTIDTDDPAERATQTVRMLKGAVRQAEGYQGLCKQNGELDLSLLGSEDDYVPVIASANVSGDTLVVEGSYFSPNGTLLVAGEEAKVLSWSEGQIEAQWPVGLTSGLIPLVVRTGTGAEACRAIPLEAPATVDESSQLYERDLASLNLRGERESITRSPQSMCATEDGVLFVAALMGDDTVDPAVSCLLRSDNQGASLTKVELPQAMQNVHLAADNGKLYVLGSTPADGSKPVDEWHLYALDVTSGSFTHLGSYEDGGPVVSDLSALAYVRGHLYLVDFYDDGDDYDAPMRLRFRRFDDDYAGVGEGFLLDHRYDRSCSYSRPLVSTSGGSVYAGGIGQRNEKEVGIDRLVGLERLDVADDGSLTCEDLTGTLSGVGALEVNDVCIAASEEGVFLIGARLEGLLPDGAAHTDTFFLRRGATSFVPYPRTLSYAPLELPSAVCSNGWLYAYATSKYEEWPVFGRATKVAGEKPDPVTPDNPDSPETKPAGSGNALPKTGDSLFGLAPVIGLFGLVGLTSLILGTWEGYRMIRSSPSDRG